MSKMREWSGRPADFRTISCGPAESLSVAGVAEEVAFDVDFGGVRSNEAEQHGGKEEEAAGRGVRHQRISAQSILTNTHKEKRNTEVMVRVASLPSRSR
jgi:hypothetical protein